MPDGIDQLGTKLAEALAPKRQDLVTVSYGTVKAVNETGADVRLDVDLHGGTLYGLPMTTACKGVAVGDRVIVQTYGHLSTVTGVIAHDNSHYVILGEGDCSLNDMLMHVVAIGFPQLNMVGLTAERTGGTFTANGPTSIQSATGIVLPERWRPPRTSSFSAMSDQRWGWSVGFQLAMTGEVNMEVTLRSSANGYECDYVSVAIPLQASS